MKWPFNIQQYFVAFQRQSPTFHPLLWWIPVFLILWIKFLTAQPAWAEFYYARTIYPPFAVGMRYLFGWIPFSLGDLLYLLVGIRIVARLFRWIFRLKSKQLPSGWGISFFKRLVFSLLWIYSIFYGFWAINYYREGAASVVNVVVKPYTTQELTQVMDTILVRLNHEAGMVDTTHRDSVKTMSVFRKMVQESYDQLGKKMPAFVVKGMSLKGSFFGRLGNYAGFSGYLNPFTHEAQINRTIPLFYQPAVACHEVAHQLGYSSENEANFVGYLSCKSSSSNVFRYSIYYDVFYYGLRELRRRDTALVTQYTQKLHPRVQQDRQQYRAFLKKYDSALEPVVNLFYDAYLRANEQSGGIESYDEVVGLLVAYARRYGLSAL